MEQNDVTVTLCIVGLYFFCFFSHLTSLRPVSTAVCEPDAINQTIDRY